MTSPINLNKARKARAKEQKRAKADENAIKFGRTKAEKTKEAQSRSAAIRHIDGHRRET